MSSTASTDLPVPWLAGEKEFAALRADLVALLRQALLEDAGPVEFPPRSHKTKLLDVTSQLLPPGGWQTLQLAARKPGVWCGLAAGEVIGEAYAGLVGRKTSPWLCRFSAADGQPARPGEVAAQLAGPGDKLLLGERSFLNLVQFLSGIASLTRQFVEAVAGTPARIYDTRKTLPGYRRLSKYAVRCGGGCNHRLGLHDAVLIKDNHLADIPLADLEKTIQAWVTRARAFHPQPKFFEVEVDSLAQFERVAGIAGVDMVLLDNFEMADMSAAVERRHRINPRLQLEASGGVNLKTVRAIAETGVDRISVGAVTHSAPALDVGLDAVR